MTHRLEALIDDPPKEDSEDLLDEEIQRAVDTSCYEHFSGKLVAEVRRRPELTIQKHELRRRGGDLFWRVHLVAGSEPEEVLVFKTNWVGG